jgi:hypothetical protein
MDNQNLTLQDFAAVLNIIDVCSSRGAFKGEELFVVGQVRERFSNFVNANAPQDDNTADETQEDETE